MTQTTTEHAHAFAWQLALDEEGQEHEMCECGAVRRDGEVYERCEDCGEFHDVEGEHIVSGVGHDYVQASTIYECDKKRFPDEEALQG